MPPRQDDSKFSEEIAALRKEVRSLHRLVAVIGGAVALRFLLPRLPEGWLPSLMRMLSYIGPLIPILLFLAVLALILVRSQRGSHKAETGD